MNSMRMVFFLVLFYFLNNFKFFYHNNFIFLYSINILKFYFYLMILIKLNYHHTNKYKIKLFFHTFRRFKIGDFSL